MVNTRYRRCLRRGTGPRAPTRCGRSASAARRGWQRLDPDHEPQAERLERRFELPELRAMGHRQQAIDLREVAVEPPRQFRFADAGGLHRLIQCQLRFNQGWDGDVMAGHTGRGARHSPFVFDVGVDDRRQRILSMSQRVGDIIPVAMRLGKTGNRTSMVSLSSRASVTGDCIVHPLTDRGLS
jgi:hypothetical protein